MPDRYQALYHSTMPAADHCYSAALDYLRAANQQTGKHPDGRVASWLSAVERDPG